jgi:hypothetical protein
MEVQPLYLFCGIGIALSVIGFFLKKLKVEVDDLKERMRKDGLELRSQHERLKHMDKLLEDRRNDIKELFIKLK